MLRTLTFTQVADDSQRTLTLGETVTFFHNDEDRTGVIAKLSHSHTMHEPCVDITGECGETFYLLATELPHA